MLSFPIQASDFWSGLRVASARFRLGGNVIQSRNGAGELLTSRRGARLWGATVTLTPMRNREAESVMAYLDMLSDAGTTMMAHPMPVYSPAHDPYGALLGGYSPVISTLASNGVEMRIDGLPPNFVLARGEFIAFSYGSPARYALHRIVSAGGAATSLGLSPLLEVRPSIRPGAATGAAVTLYKPSIKALIVPGSINYGAAEAGISSGPQFEILQTLR